MFKYRFSILLFFCLIQLIPQAQTSEEVTIIQGKVIDKRNREPLPFVTISFKGTKIGTTSDFEGNFKIKANIKVDSIKVSYVGYKTFVRKISYGQTQNLTIELAESNAELRAVTVRAGINPALRIINNARKRKDFNNQDNLSAYQYDSYNKVDISLNNISDEMKNRTMFKPIKGLFDTSFQMKNEDGKYILPLFINETFSQYYYNKIPSKNKEVMVASSTTGIGVGDKSFITDLMGTSLQQFNFNENFVRILAKDFISPLSNVCHNYYVYTLLDSSFSENGRKTYKIKLNLKQEQDLGFLGHMWIEDSTWALTRIDVEISKYANLNFIDRLKLQQEMKQTSAGPFIPYKNRMIVDIAEMTKNTSGIIAKFYNSFSNIEVNNPKPMDFYDRLIERAEEENLERDSNFWISKRPEAFSNIERRMFVMVDSIKNLPAIQTYIDVIRLVVEGYKRIGGVDWGPYVFLYGYNNVEGSRLRLGFKTNHLFSKRWVLKSHLAYGFKDEKWKYGLGVDYISNRKDWTVWSTAYRDDYDIIGITNDFGPGNNSSNVFQAISIFADGIRLNRTQEFKLGVFKQYSRDWSYKINAQFNSFEPLGDFVFAYRTGNSVDSISNNYNNTQLSAEVRWAYKELLIARGNDRLRLRRSLVPVITLTYTHGFKGVLGGNFDYNKFQIHIIHHANTGILGTADYWLTAGKIWGRLPYPLLDVARGNQVFLYSDFNYSLMNFYEFISDEYAHFTYIQHFEGLLINRIPLIKNWKWRSFAFVKAAYGNMSEEDRRILPERNTKGKELTPINSFKNNIPYVEVGYGLENIFRIFSINMVHRLTYLDQVPGLPKPRTWGINLGVRFQF